jgi:hypothetical protein
LFLNNNYATFVHKVPRLSLQKKTAFRTPFPGIARYVPKPKYYISLGTLWTKVAQRSFIVTTASPIAANSLSLIDKVFYLNGRGQATSRFIKQGFDILNYTALLTVHKQLTATIKPTGRQHLNW